MKSKVIGFRPRSFLRYPLVVLVILCAIALALTTPGDTRAQAHACWLDPQVPSVTGTYPNQYAIAAGTFHCNVSYTGYVRLRGWNGSSWNQIAQTNVGPVAWDTFAQAGGYCYTYNFVDTHMYANFSGSGQSNTSNSTDCNFP